MPIRPPSSSSVRPAPNYQPAEKQRVQAAPPKAPAATNIPARIASNGRSAAPVFWGDGPNFASTATHTLGALWALCAQRYAYASSDAAHLAFKTAVGADSADLIEFDDAQNRYPSLLKVRYPTYDVFVLRGTTNSAQVGTLTTGKLHRYNTTADAWQKWPDHWVYPAETAVKVLRQEFFGAFFDAFMELAAPIWDYLVQYVTLEKGARKLYLVGHSLGGAIWDVCVLRMAKAWWDSRYAKASATISATISDELRTASAQFDRCYQGAYLFSMPNLGFYAGGWRGELDADTPITGDGGPLTRTFPNWPWHYYSRYTRHLGHLWDPVTVIPMARRNAPFIVRWAAPGAISADVDCITHAQRWDAGVGPLEGEKQSLSPPIPDSKAELVARVNRYHTSGQLLRMYSNAVLRRFPGAPAAWLELLNAALELNGDSLAPFDWS